MNNQCENRWFARQNRAHKNVCFDSSGFTLVEALVALTILSVAIVPAYALSTSSVGIAYSIRNNVIAAGLAQEGIEVIRATRDSNWFVGSAFDTNLADGDYELQWDSIPPFSIYQDRFLYRGIQGKYRINPGGSSIQTIYKRKVSIRKISSVELMITSEILWTERNRSRSFKVESHLFDWK